MIDYQLGIGDVYTSEKQMKYVCYGLGSCIGLFIQDRQTGLSGGAHILLPDDEKGPSDEAKFYNVTGAITELMQQFRLKGSALMSLRAKITGGANVVNVNTRTGVRNVQSVIKWLTANRVFIAAMDVGGCHSRTVTFESKTGLLKVRKPEINQYKTY